MFKSCTEQCTSTHKCALHKAILDDLNTKTQLCQLPVVLHLYFLFLKWQLKNMMSFT